MLELNLTLQISFLSLKLSVSILWTNSLIAIITTILLCLTKLLAMFHSLLVQQATLSLNWFRAIQIKTLLSIRLWMILKKHIRTKTLLMKVDTLILASKFSYLLPNYSNIRLQTPTLTFSSWDDDESRLLLFNLFVKKLYKH